MKTKTKAFLTTIILTVVTVIFAIVMVVNAGNSENYAVEIVNDGSENRNVDENTEITKKIVREENSSLIYEVGVKNKLQTSNIKEVTLLVDTSKSIDINDPESSIKVKAKELVEQLFTEVPGIQVSVVDNNGIKITRGTNKTNVINTINGLTNAYGSSVDETLELAKSTFTNGSSNSKLIITFTDATDTMQKVQELQDEGINAITILTNMTRASYQVDGVSTIGDTYMIDTVTIEPIIDSLNKSLKNIEIRDVFSANILKYFDVSIEDPDNTPIEVTADGYIWRIDKIFANNTATAQFRLTLKENVTIDENDTYKEIQTSSNMNVSYDNKGTRENYDVADSPIVEICKKYSVKIKAVNGEYKSLPVDGIDVRVKVQKADGAVVFDDTLTTDSDGNITIDNLKTLGNLTFTVDATVNKTGYVSTRNNMTFEIYNDLQGKSLSVTTTGIDVKNIDNDKRIVEVLFPIQAQVFNLEVNLADIDNSLLKIGDVEFRLIQPTINSKDELKAIYGTTDVNGQVVFRPTVMPKDGTYDYILSQITEPTNYEPMGNVTLKITFEDGRVTKIEKKYNENVTAERVRDDYGIVNVFNINKENNKLNFELELSDNANHDNKLSGAIYNIEVSKDGENTETFTNQVTDSNGHINLEITGRGYIKVKVKEVRPTVGYYKDNVEKEFIVHRENGKIAILGSLPPEIYTDIESSTIDNKVKLNLYSRMNALQSMIQVKVVDIQEGDIPLPGVNVKLIGTMTNEEYTATVEADGIAKFLVQPQDAGTYQYKIEIDNNSLPNGYSAITEPILVSVRFDGERKITEASDISGPIVNVPIVDEYNTTDFTYKFALFEIGVDINDVDSYNFQVNLSDRVNGNPIGGAKYDITIDNGTTVRRIPGRETNQNGQISTRLIASDHLTITVTETKSAIGYKIDNVDEVIELTKVNGVYKITNGGVPYDYGDFKNGPVVQGKNINYYHTNSPKGNDSVLLNLYVDKVDDEGNYLSGIPCRVYSDTLQDPEGNLLNQKVITGNNEKGGPGYFELEKIKVTNIDIPKDSVHYLYIVETGSGGDDIESTLIKLKLTFRYNDNKQYVELTQAEPTWGNHLMVERPYTSGQETDIAYESNLHLTVYGNYDEVGNFALDLRKVDVEEQKLDGAKYDVTITRPDGSKIIRTDLDITDETEFSGILVSEGTTIEITEAEAPIGYQLNKRTELIRVDSVGSDGSITFDYSGTTDKLKIVDTRTVAIDSDHVKTSLILDLVDESLNTFKFGIKTKDKNTEKGVSGFGYRLYSTKGAQIESELTNSQGDVSTRIGGNYAGETVTYTIREIKTAKYYKPLANPIEVKVVFAEDGTVDSNATLVAQTDPNYGTIWNIVKTNTEDGNYIDIEIKNDTQEELKVKLNTIDRFTGNVFNDATYQITPSLNLVASGTTDISVGYVAPNSMEQYYISQIGELARYQRVKNETFTITYDENGNISADPNNLSSNLEFVSRNGKTLELNVYIEPEFLINIQNEDSLNTSQKLSGTLYSVESNAGIKDDDVLTGANGIGIARLGSTIKNEKVIYTIKELRPSPLYQSIKDDVKIEVTYDANGFVDTVNMLQGNDYAEVSKISPITDQMQNFEINVIIRNCKMVKFNITKVDRATGEALRGVRFNATSTLNGETLHTTTMQTDTNGQGVLGLDKDYANETITYTITETEKLSGYQYPAEELVIEVTFDSDGRIIPSSVKIMKGNSYTTLGTIDANAFTIDLAMTNDETEEFGVNILSIDKYDPSIKIESVDYKAYLSTPDNQIDSNYVGNGTTDINGETYIQFGKYVSSNPNEDETRRLIIKESNLNENYRKIRAEIVVDVTFDPNGVVKNVNIPGGYNSNIGWLADSRFISVEKRTHTISVTIRHYPYLFMNVKAVDMYTGDELVAKYHISTQGGPHYGTGAAPYATNIDYFGNGYGETLEADYNTTTDGEWSKVGIGPTGTNETKESWRTFYIFEKEEPSSPMQYQKYRPRRLLNGEYSRIIGKIIVHYNDKGRIESWDLQETSNNNIENNFIEVEILDGQNLGIKIKYAPTTTMEVTTRDAVSKETLSNIRVSPYLNDTYTTNTSYEYRTIGYYTTDTNGNTNYKYWGANINEGQNEYHINTSRMGWNGYFDSGLVKIHVAYDENGRISAADILSTDVNGTPNAEIVGFENNNLKINILYNRKFNIKINKQDEYDKNMKLTATFNGQSEKGANADIRSGTVATLGMIWPGQKVRYNLTETIVPQGYFPIKNVEFDVTFDNDGKITKVDSNSDIFDVLNIRETTDKVRPTMVQDLEVAIENEPQFIVKLNVMDNYYREKGLEGVTYSITSEPDSATGNPVTDNTGRISVPVGKPYANQTKVYTIIQTSTPNGYYPNYEIVKLEVKFNELGKITDYRIKQGEKAVEIDADAFKNQRYVELDMIGNKPKDLELGIVNIDKLTGQVIPGDTYHVKAEEIKGGTAIRDKDFVINDDGNIIDKINEFKETPGQEREVLYTISQITKTNTYRKIQDIVLKITFNEDGSIKYRNILSNPSNVKVDVALSGKLQYIGTNPVHIKLTIENDNTYDLIVKDEDKNYQDLGILGTNYDITVNGERLNLTTDENGLAKSLNRTESGTITIKIAEKEAGIGYKTDLTNETTVVVQKGTVDYSLDLVSNSNPNAEVDVNSEYGTINVKFKNETKSSIKLLKNLADVRYKITEQEKNDETLTPIRVIGTDLSDTESKVELYYELGVTPQNKVRVYTFEELSAPSTYVPIGRFNVFVEYDMYGKIKNITTDSNRVSAIENVGGSHDIVVIVGEPTDPGAYTVKVVSQEVDSNLRINESKFTINMTDEAGNEIIDQRNNKFVTANIVRNGYVVEKGAIKIGGLKNTGNINIQVDQTETAEGYKYGTQTTSGTVKVKVTYEQGIPKIEILDTSLDVEVDEVNHEIIIKVNNEPETQMYINNVLKTKNAEKETVMENIEGSKFEITSAIQTTTDITETDLNVTTKETDAEGNTSAKVGIPYLGKTVLYTIHQIETLEYEPIGDIVVLVQYDTKGLIKHYEIISNADDAIVTGDQGTRNIRVQIINTKRKNKHGYRIVVEKHHISNEEYGELIPGAKFRIEVEQEYGAYYTSWEAITDQNGLITSQLFDGYGNIKVKLTEIEAPKGFELSEGTTEIRFNRDKDTGELRKDFQQEGFDFSQNNDVVYIKPVNKPKKDLYTIILNKVDTKTQKMITQSSAKFDVTMINEENIGTEEEPEIEEVETYLGEFITNNNGKAKLENLQKPEKAGTYKYIITEKEAPEGYLPLTESVELEVNFIENEDGEIEMSDISDIRILSGDAVIRNKAKDLLNITINNFNHEDVNKYTLDITKVDAHTGEPIENMAIFKVGLPDENNTSVYTETMENDYGKGKLDYCYIEQDKDYSTRLTRMEIPKEPGIHEYVFKEITPPEGYIKLEDELKLTVEFGMDEISNEIIIDKITPSNPKYMEIKTETPCSTDTPIEVNILNNSVVYTVEYRANDNDEGASNLPGTQNKGEDIPINLDTKVPERIGYEFLGWATYKEATTPEYQPGDVYDKNADLVLYAVWKKARFTITYDDNIEDAEITMPDAQIKEKGQDLKLSDYVPTRDGYEFLGWATDKESTNAEYQSGANFAIDEDTTLYAIWKLKLYTITYDDNVDSLEIPVPKAQEKRHDEDIDLSEMILDDRIENGFTKIFDGWKALDKDGNQLYDEAGNEIIYQPGDSYTENVDLILSAIWEDEIYLRSDEYQIINAEVDTSNRRKDKVIYDTEKIHEYNDGDKFIIGIRPQYNKTRAGKKPTEDKKGTTLETLISNLNTNADKITVIKKTWDSAGTSIVDEEIAQEDLVGTNMTIKLTKGRKQSIQLILAVIGDVWDEKTTTVCEEGSIIYYSGDGIITASDVSTSATMCPTGKFTNNKNNLLLSGMGFVLSLDVLHNNMSTAWRSNIDNIYKTGSSTNIMDYIKQNGNW